uniref:Uncharacterized protein n=1 Tax=Lotharella oceanica TaxID=641309 RepID=A0A7S2TT76_9EUKA|mmetsp:Transcript_28581/g.53577  ORF Transcript_28581/g.53577 Transcript_28581/m.53577 type:complete len:102 (+) Transcript_28581:575-880(+)
MTFQGRESETFMSLVLWKSGIHTLMEILKHNLEMIEPDNSRLGCRIPSQLKFRACISQHVKQTHLIPLIEARHLLHAALLRNVNDVGRWTLGALNVRLSCP